MSDPRRILLVGGDADGRAVTLLHGSAVVFGPLRETYRICSLFGSTREFFVGVPTGKMSDGDWLIEQLLNRYEGNSI